ncbi:MAG: hypothetical protein ACJAVA_002154 [Flavobacteriaceae bacterium]|jgi:hypothetical protein
MTLTGQVKGLKKGTLLLQKIENFTLVTIDSIVINGEEIFNLTSIVASPEIYYLHVKISDGTLLDDRIAFFAEPKEISIQTNLNNFNTKAIIIGSENQNLLNDYNQLMKRYSAKNLELIEQDFNGKKDGNDSLVNDAQQKQRNILSNRYLATVNFAFGHSDFEIAPYLMVHQVNNINKKYLDTVYNKITPKIKDSKYGKALESLIKSREN